MSEFTVKLRVTAEDSPTARAVRRLFVEGILPAVAQRLANAGLTVEVKAVRTESGKDDGWVGVADALEAYRMPVEAAAIYEQAAERVGRESQTRWPVWRAVEHALADWLSNR